MAKVVITGVGGLVGSEAALQLHRAGYEIIGIENDSRGMFFGPNASVKDNLKDLRQKIPHLTILNADIRNQEVIESALKTNADSTVALIHAAAQPSHDWSATHVIEDFQINATGTVILLESCRRYLPRAKFIFISTNKVYGDHYNNLPFLESDRRFDLPINHPLYSGIVDLKLPISAVRSPFGVSKLSGDLMVQEFGSYFGMKTYVLRLGCITGASQQGVECHGFLSHIVRSCLKGQKLNIFGFDGKQVRDVIHVSDLARALKSLIELDLESNIFNIGGGRANSCSLLEIIESLQEKLQREIEVNFSRQVRVGDHQWWVTDNDRLSKAIGGWKVQSTLDSTVDQLIQHWRAKPVGYSGEIDETPRSALA